MPQTIAAVLRVVRLIKMIILSPAKTLRAFFIIRHLADNQMLNISLMGLFQRLDELNILVFEPAG